jgi:putative transposase
VACDFFTLETAWLKRIYVLFFISLQSRRIELTACTPNPTGAWVTQQARNLLMTLDDHQQTLRLLIHDRDAKFSSGCDHVFRSEGITVVRTPVQAPNANAHAERWVGSVRRECLDRVYHQQGNSSTCFASMPAITTGIGRIGHSHSMHPSNQIETRQRCEGRPIRC